MHSVGESVQDFHFPLRLGASTRQTVKERVLQPHFRYAKDQSRTEDFDRLQLVCKSNYKNRRLNVTLILSRCAVAQCVQLLAH